MTQAATRPAPAGGWGPWLQQVFDRLYAHLGPRHWWPAQTPFEVVVGAILTQNVAWVNVEKAIANLRAAGLLDPAAMAAAPAERLAELIRPSGYYRSKAKKLKAFLAHVQQRYGGDLERLWALPLVELGPEIYGIWGVGPETGDCILCYAAGKPVMAMDAYTRRVFSRLGALAPDASYAQMQALFHGHLPANTQLFNEYHALIDGLANRICLKRRPRCGQCPLADICPRLGVEEAPV